jgi:Flp pilus assembly protein TadG
MMRIPGKQTSYWRCRLGNWRRRGTAVVEFALVSPVLLIIAIGLIDVGQFISIGQIVNNASREGSRVAIRDYTDSVSEVEAAVLTYMTNALSEVSAETINSALQVVVREGNGTVAGEDLSLVNSGQELRVEVTFDYQNVRWAPNSFLGAYTVIQATTIMRRE